MSTSDARDTCDFCGSEKLVWRKCKQVCLDCGSIVRSCADLAEHARDPDFGAWPPR